MVRHSGRRPGPRRRLLPRRAQDRRAEAGIRRFAFCFLAHDEGNGGCLVPGAEEISPTGGILVYLNVDGRIRDAVAQVEQRGGKVREPLHAIGPHGFRAVVLDSEGNRIALHSSVDA